MNQPDIYVNQLDIYVNHPDSYVNHTDIYVNHPDVRYQLVFSRASLTRITMFVGILLLVIIVLLYFQERFTVTKVNGATNVRSASGQIHSAVSMSLSGNT